MLPLSPCFMHNAYKDPTFPFSRPIGKGSRMKGVSKNENRPVEFFQWENTAIINTVKVMVGFKSHWLRTPESR